MLINEATIKRMTILTTADVPEDKIKKNYIIFVCNWWGMCECSMVVWMLKGCFFVYVLSCIVNFVMMWLYSFISVTFRDNLMFIGLFVSTLIGWE